jgi:hypothetical protein
VRTSGIVMNWKRSICTIKSSISWQPLFYCFTSLLSSLLLRKAFLRMLLDTKGLNSTVLKSRICLLGLLNKSLLSTLKDLAVLLRRVLLMMMKDWLWAQNSWLKLKKRCFSCFLMMLIVNCLKRERIQMMNALILIDTC